MSDIILHASIYAEAAHAAVGQVRKYTGNPYIEHPRAVARIVQRVEHDVNMVAAAMLHDVVEDTKVTVAAIRDRFGDDIAGLVEWLTDVSKPGDGVRAVRRAIDREHSAAAPARAQTIKVADLIDNTKSIVDHDPEFARVYLEEKALLIDVLTKADPRLIDEANHFIEWGRRKVMGLC